MGYEIKKTVVLPQLENGKTQKYSHVFRLGRNL